MIGNLQKKQLPVVQGSCKCFNTIPLYWWVQKNSQKRCCDNCHIHWLWKYLLADAYAKQNHIPLVASIKESLCRAFQITIKQGQQISVTRWETAWRSWSGSLDLKRPTFHEPWLAGVMRWAKPVDSFNSTWIACWCLKNSTNLITESFSHRRGPQVCDGKRLLDEWMSRHVQINRPNKFIIEVSFFFLTLSSLSWSLKGNKIREILQESVKTIQSYSNSTKHLGERHSFKLQIFTLSFVIVFLTLHLWGLPSPSCLQAAVLSTARSLGYFSLHVPVKWK